MTCQQMFLLQKNLTIATSPVRVLKMDKITPVKRKCSKNKTRNIHPPLFHLFVPFVLNDDVGFLVDLFYKLSFFLLILQYH